MLASIARLRFTDKGIIKCWTIGRKRIIIERQGVGYLVVSSLGSTPELAYIVKIFPVVRFEK